MLLLEGSAFCIGGSTPERRSPRAHTVQDAIDTYRSETLDSLLTWSILAMVAALALAVALGWLVAGRALRPLRRFTETATRVADRSLHERIALAGPDDEIKTLADTIDAMLERLDRSFDAQRRFVANASHELRTPLATNRTMLEVPAANPEVSDDLRRLAPDLLATNERSKRLVEGLLTLARSEQGCPNRRPSTWRRSRRRRWTRGNPRRSSVASPWRPTCSRRQWRAVRYWSSAWRSTWSERGTPQPPGRRGTCPHRTHRGVCRPANRESGTGTGCRPDRGTVRAVPARRRADRVARRRAGPVDRPVGGPRP